jgi:mannose-1-phosphate guanylyltransferase
VERAVILNGTQIGEGCRLRDCIVAGGCRIGARTTVTGGAVLGEGVTLGADNVIAHGARIFPGVTLADGAIKF